ncbi:glycosyltransferase family 2 protein [Christiangramia crocea]|uniref:Glycosyltransferase family 2 protein n=1 Tax=Christiangramia crocea TaxID=2904124 RepID=A0A9X2A468_9FLAO|nr:glycosyltransferase family A protein [Gramella crocea]MCG9970424.1 glycosyltransferase family 2 protein [Gramella crocea]
MITFSIIIPTYNHGDKISRAVNSLLKQSFENWELIIVDDGSTDHTSEVVTEFQNDPRIRYVYQKNSGVSMARNRGIDCAQGEYVLFLDSDDEVTSRWLEDFYKIIKDTTEVGIVSCGIKLIKGKDRLPRINKNISNYKYQNIPGSFLLHQKVIKGIKGYDINLKHSENWELMARALEYSKVNKLKILSINKCNLKYNLEEFPEKTYLRDRDRAHAGLYLYKKYYYNGVLHFNKYAFLKQAAINSIRINKIKRGRVILKKLFLKKPGFDSFLSLLISYIPPIRSYKWERKS